ncbi:MAG: glutamate--tRNA ligase family protein [Balneolaceae bacterium]|nr:glutamate--tRNA ligase family protein [Balneolaceae bacterium]
MSDSVRVRFAPSPTGLLHIGWAPNCTLQLPVCQAS